MKKNNFKLRKCIVCGQQKTKEDLIRIVKDKDGNINIDHSGKMNGRGAYICKQGTCIQESIDKKILNKNLRVKVPNEIYGELQAM